MKCSDCGHSFYDDNDSQPGVCPCCGDYDYDDGDYPYYDEDERYLDNTMWIKVENCKPTIKRSKHNDSVVVDLLGHKIFFIDNDVIKSDIVTAVYILSDGYFVDTEKNGSIATFATSPEELSKILLQKHNGEEIEFLPLPVSKSKSQKKNKNKEREWLLKVIENIVDKNKAYLLKNDTYIYYLKEDEISRSKNMSGLRIEKNNLEIMSYDTSSSHYPESFKVFGINKETFEKRWQDYIAEMETKINSYEFDGNLKKKKFVFDESDIPF